MLGEHQKSLYITSFYKTTLKHVSVFCKFTGTINHRFLTNQNACTILVVTRYSILQTPFPYTSSTSSPSLLNCSFKNVHFVYRYLTEPFDERGHVSVDGITLDKSLVNLTEVCTSNREAVFKGVFLHGKQRVDLPLKTLYVTSQERESASELKNIKKADLVKMIEELLLSLNDESLLEFYREKLAHIQKRLASTKKEVIIALHEEINQKFMSEDDIQEYNKEVELEDP